LNFFYLDFEGGFVKVGKILWWDGNQNEGVIRDGTGAEYYFNYSAVSGRLTSQIADGRFVEFQTIVTADGQSCAKDITLIPVKSEKRAIKRISQEKQLALELG